MNKTWKTKAIYNYYDDASEIKNLLLANDETGLLEVKIRRCGPGGTKFKIKTYFPELKKKEKTSEKKINKKTKGSRNS
jgi:hypothetical protein